MSQRNKAAPPSTFRPDTTTPEPGSASRLRYRRAVSPRAYFAVILRHWLVIAVTVLIGMGAGFGIAQVTHKQYRATAQILFSGHATTNGQDLAYVGSYAQGRLTTYQRLGESSSVLRPVVHALGTKESLRKLRTRLELNSIQGTSILTIRATDSTRKGAEATAGAVASQLRWAVERLENGSKSSARASINATIIGRAEAPKAPVRPNLPLNLLLGAFVGLVVSLSLVTLRAGSSALR